MKKSIILSFFGLFLSLPMMAQTVRAPQTIDEAVKALPALPTVEQISSEQAKDIVTAKIYDPYRRSLELLMLDMNNRVSEINLRLQQINAKKQQQNQQAMQKAQGTVRIPSQQEIMQMYMSGEINENMSEEQILAVMMKKYPDLGKAPAGAPSGAYADTPDPREERFTQIMDELDRLLEELTITVSSYAKSPVDELDDQLPKDWESSSENQQVTAIEDKLWARVAEWESNLNVYDGEVSYPKWWCDERKKENKLIDQWNRRNAEKWLDLVKEQETKYRTLFTKVAALETENEQLGKGDEDNVLYWMNKQRLVTISGGLLQLTIPYTDALRFPCVEKLPEEGTVSLGVGN